MRQSKANVLEVANAVQKELPAVRASLPPGVELHMAFDGSVFVQRSITEAKETLLITAGLVILIIFLFLATARATIIPALAIPVSIVGTFAVLNAFGYSVNTLTLLGLILAIGIVVDDAIIVMENAYRHQEELHKDPETAAIDGTREITTAVIATTISLLAVFSPLLFLTGATGRLFNEFGAAVGGSVLISGIVALTLTPMLSAKILRVAVRESRFHHIVGSVLNGVTSFYERLLGGALGRPFIVIGGGALLTLSAVFLFKNLKREFVPPDDRGFFFTFVVAPEGASLRYTDGYLKQLEDIVAKTKDVRSTFSFIGFNGPPSSGFLGTILEDWDKRKRTAQDVIGEVQPQFFGVPGVFAFATNPPAFGGFGAPVQFVVQNRDFEALVRGMDTLTTTARTIPGLLNVDTDLRVTKPELVVNLDRDRAEDLGVPARDIATTLQTLLGGRDVSRFTSENKLYDVILRLDPAERATPSDITGIQVRGKNNTLVPLDAVTRVEEHIGPRQLNHFNQRSIIHALGEHGARIHARRSARLAQCARGESSSCWKHYRACRTIARVQGLERRTLLRVRARSHLRVHGSRSSVRIAAASIYGSARGAARRHRCAHGALDHQVHAERLQPDRNDSSDRPRVEELDSSRHVRQSAPPGRTRRTLGHA